MQAISDAVSPGTVTEFARKRVRVSGVVQGVGFRPFVYRLAVRHGLTGFVRNSGAGVCIEVEGRRKAIDAFLAALAGEAPVAAVIDKTQLGDLAVAGDRHFELRISASNTIRQATLLPDLATCDACYQEVFDPANRRYQYPFTNCTQCGPRFSIVDSLPYDRANTSMKHFTMCRLCEEEYRNPLDRRFHAQPIACPACGPQLALMDAKGCALESRHNALQTAALHLQRGAIVALKGLGGFQFLVDASNEQAVQRLRQKKQRPAKPLAVMVKNAQVAAALCKLTPQEEQLLRSPQAPIVLLQRQNDGLAPSVAPELDQLGVMLPHTPLHHLLLHELDGPLVVTSGNLAGEPICTGSREALQRLCDVADFFLLHNRGIVRPLDDSVVRIAAGRPLLLRRARGYAPLPLKTSEKLPVALAVGGQLKNTVGLAVQNQLVLSQHIGNLGSPQTQQRFEQEIDSLLRYFRVQPNIVLHDMHPEYSSTRWAQKQAQKTQAVQHHRAHVYACMADNDLQAPCLGVAWDGVGYGDDGSLWGGEFFSVTTAAGAPRYASFRSFPLPGGTAAIVEPRRAALGLLYAMLGNKVWHTQREFIARSFSAAEITVLKTMLTRGLNCPHSSSVGRLYDAVAALLGVSLRLNYEAEAAMQLEQLAQQSATTDAYAFRLQPGVPLVLDWQAMVEAILDDYTSGIAAADIAARLHNTLAQMLLTVARGSGHTRVVLGGGCFQNRVLLEECIAKLQAYGFDVFWPKALPPNDGALAAGQLYWLAQQQAHQLCV